MKRCDKWSKFASQTHTIAYALDYYYVSACRNRRAESAYRKANMYMDYVKAIGML